MAPSVELEEVERVREALVAQARSGYRELPVSVTDLLDPRPAFFRRFSPVPLPAERRRRRALGTEGHRRWSRRLGSPESVERRVERAGIVGVVDLWEPDGPTELKTTGRLGPIDRLREDRGSYFDQLGLYCALTDAPSGRLVVVGVDEGASSPPVLAVRCGYDGLPSLLEAAAGRAERFRRSLRSHEPTELPRCGWFGRHCPYETAKVCGCTGEEPADARWVQEHLRSSTPDPDSAARWSGAIRAAESEPPTVLRTFSDLLWPRRAYFEERYPERVPERAEPDPGRSASYRALADAVESLPASLLDRRSPPSGDPPVPVPTFESSPYVVKVYGGAVPDGPLSIGSLPSHYGRELGFRAAALGTDRTWLFLAFLRRDGPPGWRAARVRLVDPEAWTVELERIRSALAEAARSGDPRALDPCPGWMASGCPYADSCGCPGAAPGS